MVLPYELRSENEWDPKLPKFPPVTPPVYMGFTRKKETIEDIMLDPRKNQMFNRWKVPDRIVDSPPAMRSGGLGDILEVGAVRSPSAKSSASQRIPVTSRAPSVRSMASPKPASRMAREMSLPNIKLRPTLERNESRNGLQKNIPMLPKSPDMKPKMSALQRSKTMMAPSRKVSDMQGASFDSALRPEAVPQAEAWMKHADKADRSVIERVLKMASSKNKLENSLRHTLLPDAKDSVDKWMKGANENERQVALDFFNSLAGGQLMGMTVEGKRKRLKEVISSLENGQVGNRFKGKGRRKETISDGNLKYIRLLTPDTRENRWMFSTWHHLPEHNDDNIVGNWSSHYIRPHAGVPRHYTIHPDWGP